MGNKELIMRGDVLKEAVYLDVDTNAMVVFVQDIKKIPAVPREMTAREYLETEARMCKYYGLPCAFDVSGMTVDEAIEMVEKFAQEHPERSTE